MDQQQVNIYYTGNLKQGIDINIAAAQLAVSFKISSEKSLKILQVNNEITLISKLEPIKACEYKSVLEDIGLLVRLEKVKTIDTKPIIDLANQETTSFFPSTRYRFSFFNKEPVI